jgi:5-methylcytosine-specific restriction endonuclease McrA
MRAKNDQSILKFYKSKEWEIARLVKISAAKGFCEKCGGVGTEVHHIIHLTKENVTDPSISLSQDNLMLLCVDCHNKEHKRFSSKSETTFDQDGNFIKRK